MDVIDPAQIHQKGKKNEQIVIKIIHLCLPVGRWPPCINTCTVGNLLEGIYYIDSSSLESSLWRWKLYEKRNTD